MSGNDNGAASSATIAPSVTSAPTEVTLELSPVPGLSVAPLTAGLQFTRIRPIGDGEGRHEVFLALDHQLNAELVYKRVPKTSFPSVDEFYAEARRLYASRHRHVVPIAYACEHTDCVYIVMPYFARGSVQAVLKARYLTAREIVRVGLDFLMGLHHAHVRGVLHFDVKPTNIFIDDSGAATLADFGQSRIADMAGFAAMPDMYAMHVPPEALSASHLTRLADVYQAGLTLYRMCIGHAAWERQVAPFGGQVTGPFCDALQHSKFPDRNAFPEHIPTRLRTLVQKALRIDPDKRWPTVLDLMNQLATVKDEAALDWRPCVEAHGGMSWLLMKEQSGKRIDLIPDATGVTWKVEVSRVGASPARLKSQCRPPSSEAVARSHVHTLLGVS